MCGPHLCRICAQCVLHTGVLRLRLLRLHVHLISAVLVVEVVAEPLDDRTTILQILQKKCRRIPVQYWILHIHTK